MTKPILLVEDDNNDVFFFKHAMKKENLMNPLQVASDGQEAIDYLQGAGKFGNRDEFPLPALIVLDLKLPFVMGLEVLKWIRQQSELTPIVIVLSSSREQADIATAYRLGANAYLVKSPDLDKLQVMLRAIKDFWLTHNLPPENSESKEIRAPAHSKRQANNAKPVVSKPEPKLEYENNNITRPG